MDKYEQDTELRRVNSNPTHELNYTNGNFPNIYSIEDSTQTLSSMPQLYKQKNDGPVSPQLTALSDKNRQILLHYRS